MREIVLSIIGLLSPVSLIILIVGYFIRKHKRFKKYYVGIINSPKALKPVDIMGIRGDEGHGFRSYYFERNEVDGEIRRIVNDRKHVLITGKPLSGKTRLIYQTMKMLGDNYVIVIPRMVDIDPSEFLFPPKTVQKKIMIVVFDDMDKFAGKQNFQFLMEGLLRQGAMIVATVRSGPEHERLRKTLETGHSLIFSQRFEIPSLSEDEASVIAKETGRGLSSGFDGTAGSIFLGLEAMKGRFDECSSVEKSVLKCIKRLYYSGLYLEREVFSLKQIRNLGRVWKQLELSQYQWDEIVENLEKVGFITVEGEKVFADKAILSM